MSSENFLRLHGPISLATQDHKCWSCHRPTPVHTLIAADVEDVEEGEEPTLVEAPSFVYDLGADAMPAALASALATLAPTFKPSYSRTLGETTWANVCTHCDSLQGAFFLHNEPDGPFFGGPEEFKGAVQVLSEAGFDVDDASYSM
jgi:hypothetical protein